MELIGQYDSPFVRRVGIAMRRYGMTFRQEPWSVWADAEALGRVNPLRRVPVLVLDDGTGPGGYVLGALDTRAFEARCEREWWPPLRADTRVPGETHSQTSCPAETQHGKHGLGHCQGHPRV